MSIYHPMWFYLITIGATFLLSPIAAYCSNHQPLQKFLFPLLLLALSIPCITALSMIFGSRNEGLINDFLHRLTLFKISVPNLLFILLFMPCVIYLATGVSLLFGYSSEQFSLAKEISAMKGWAIFGILIPLVLAPLIEELGWRGYGVDSLRAHFNLFNASVLFGILWAVWHLPPFFVKGFYQNGLWNLGIVYVINFFVSVFVIAILMNWIYYKTGRSIPALVLFHAMLNLSSMAFRTEPFTKCIATVILCVSAVFIIAYDKEYFFKNSRLEIASNRLQTVLDDLRAEYGFPGVTCAYVLSDGTIGEAASGFADKETLQPMTPQSRMLAASIGKSFVAATILSLAGEGKLHLDDRLSKTLGQCSWFSRLPNHNTITLRHLLTHSSGLPDHVHIQDAKEHMQHLQESLRSMGGVFSPESLIEFVLDNLPLFEAGRGWAYTDTGYILLGLAIEHVTQNSYAQELQKRFLIPLHLDHTTLSDRPTLPGLVAGYTSQENPFGFAQKTLDVTGAMVWNPVVEWTGGGIISSPRDLAIWAKALYEGGAMAFDYLPDLLQSVSLPDARRYGAGVLIDQVAGFGERLGHLGLIPGYVSSMRYYPKYRMAIAFQLNTDVVSADLIKTMELRLAEVVVNQNYERIPMMKINS